MTDKEVLVGHDDDGKEVKYLVRTPNAENYRKSQLAYNKVFREALDSGALLRQKLNDYMRSQKLWDDEKQQKYEKLVKEISDSEDALKAGGIRLSKAKEIAISIKGKREEFKRLISERNSLDSNSAEGLADNARFAALIRMCILKPENNLPYFPEEKDYDAQSSQPWVIEAAEKLANMLYGLDPNYEKNLEENKFLKEFEFIDEELDLINKDGHKIDIDGRLVNDEGRYVAYRNDEDYKNRTNFYYVNRDGKEVVLLKDEWVRADATERKPFLDEDDNPIALEVESLEKTEQEEVDNKEGNNDEKNNEKKNRTRASKKTENTI